MVLRDPLTVRRNDIGFKAYKPGRLHHRLQHKAAFGEWQRRTSLLRFSIIPAALPIHKIHAVRQRGVDAIQPQIHCDCLA